MNWFLPPDASLSTRVVYDKKTGAVVHVHRAVSFPGAKGRDDAGLDSRALELAGHMTKRKAAEIAVLRVENDQLQPDRHYKVDMKRASLVAITPAGRGKSKRSS